ncbi:hypothetical protein [Sandarakinorhabdus sp. DWP1-3-1]|uniref:hypothetical protein n=1 Tax=Sandarakinorhabdus sp. DWP1-3-1 TaxID=2804627 RepID=UPI003CFBAFB0
MPTPPQHQPQATPPWRVIGWGGAALLLAAPLAAMQFTAEMRWDIADFAMFGTMLLVAGTALELLVRVTRAGRVRAILGVAVAVAFLSVWADAAVGVFPA